MNTIFMNSENSNTITHLTGKIDLRRKVIYIALSNFSVYYTQRNINKSYKNNNFKISALPQNEEFELPDGSYSISDIYQRFFWIYIKKAQGKTVNLATRIYINTRENRITFKIKTDFILNF